jgi:hypothetical protein
MSIQKTLPSKIRRKDLIRFNDNIYEVLESMHRQKVVLNVRDITTGHRETIAFKRDDNTPSNPDNFVPLDLLNPAYHTAHLVYYNKRDKEVEVLNLHTFGSDIYPVSDYLFHTLEQCVDDDGTPKSDITLQIARFPMLKRDDVYLAMKMVDVQL